MEGGWLRAARRYSLAIAAVAGLGLVAVAALFGASSFLGSFLLSVGGAMIAAVLVAFFALAKDEFLQRLWDLGVDNLFVNRATEVRDGYWMSLISDAHHHYRAMGAAHHGYISTEVKRQRFREAFRQAIVVNRIDVEFMWLNPESLLATRRESEEHRDTRRDAVETMEFFSDLRQNLPEPNRRQLVLREFDRIPSCGIVWSDNRLVVTHYLPAGADLFSPGIILRQGTASFPRLRRLLRQETMTVDQLADVYTGIYEELRAASSEVTPERLAHLSDVKGAFARTRSEADLRANA